MRRRDQRAYVITEGGNASTVTLVHIHKCDDCRANKDVSLENAVMSPVIVRSWIDIEIVGFGD